VAGVKNNIPPIVIIRVKSPAVGVGTGRSRKVSGSINQIRLRQVRDVSAVREGG